MRISYNYANYFNDCSTDDRGISSWNDDCCNNITFYAVESISIISDVQLYSRGTIIV